MEKYRVELAKKSDFEKVKETYLYIIKNSLGMEEYARWEYGKHPNDESIRNYIDNDQMYILYSGEKIMGVVAITLYQGEDYHGIEWISEAKDNEVMVLHLLGFMPKYQGRGLSHEIMKIVLDMGKDKGMKSCRLDTLGSNKPAQKFYSKLGFTYCGKQNWYADNTGWTDFLLYEYVL